MMEAQSKCQCGLSPVNQTLSTLLPRYKRPQPICFNFQHQHHLKAYDLRHLLHGCGLCFSQRLIAAHNQSLPLFGNLHHPSNLHYFLVIINHKGNKSDNQHQQHDLDCLLNRQARFAIVFVILMPSFFAILVLIPTASGDIRRHHRHHQCLSWLSLSLQ